MRTTDYPLLDAFLGAWFHQDCMINGETLADIVAAYCAVTRPDDRRALRDEITRFLDDAREDTPSRRLRAFDLDIVPEALVPAGDDFARAVQCLLDKSAER